jgi:hypothetical protein
MVLTMTHSSHAERDNFDHNVIQTIDFEVYVQTC